MGCILSTLIALLGIASSAQPPSIDFETVSIKPHDPEIAITASGIRGSEWIVTNMSLLQLVQVAYPEFSEPARVVGGDQWNRETTFDIRAKSAGPLTFPTVQTMIRRLLADRFRQNRIWIKQVVLIVLFAHHNAIRRGQGTEAYRCGIDSGCYFFYTNVIDASF